MPYGIEKLTGKFGQLALKSSARNISSIPQSKNLPKIDLEKFYNDFSNMLTSYKNYFQYGTKFIPPFINDHTYSLIGDHSKQTGFNALDLTKGVIEQIEPLKTRSIANQIREAKIKSEANGKKLALFIANIPTTDPHKVEILHAINKLDSSDRIITNPSLAHLIAICNRNVPIASFPWVLSNTTSLFDIFFRRGAIEYNISDNHQTKSCSIKANILPWPINKLKEVPEGVIPIIYPKEINSTTISMINNSNAPQVLICTGYGTNPEINNLNKDKAILFRSEILAIPYFPVISNVDSLIKDNSILMPFSPVDIISQKLDSPAKLPWSQKIKSSATDNNQNLNR